MTSALPTLRKARRRKARATTQNTGSVLVLATLPTMNYARRLSNLQSALEENKLNCLLVTHLPNIQYLCGFTGSSAALLVGDRGSKQSSVLFTDGRYISQVKEEVHDANVVIAPKSPPIASADWLAARQKNSRVASAITVGIEPESMTAGLRDRLASLLKGKARLRSAPPLIERLRMVKDADEIARIRKAVALGETLFDVACRKIRPGVKEVEVAAEMEYEARRAGAEGMSFTTILASGKRSAVVHGRASAARIPARGFVVCDFGVILAGYCSDRTRTLHVGRPSREATRIYNAVLEAQEAGISAVRPGVTAAKVHGAAREVLQENKLARHFTHSTGHGLGLEIHEAPRLAAGQTQKLEPGMVITIEPGAYIPGKGGVRIEDVVVVTKSGCEVLSPGNKELVTI